MIRIIVDMMGGDNGSAATKEAVTNFLKDHDDVEIIAVGNEEEIKDLSCEKIFSTDVIAMESGVMEVLRKKDSSMVKAIRAVIEKEADAVVSCGSTGAYLSAATLILKKIPGVRRPALVTQFPRLSDGGFITVLDIGASNENTPEEIAQFAYMGSLYNKAVNGVDSPKVALLSNGSEEGKGSPEGKAAFELMSKDPKINFIGNLEGNAVLYGEADVLVSDGFTGNVFLKSSEGAVKGIGKVLKKGFTKNIFTKIGYLFAKGGLKEMKTRMDPKKVGGAMLIGVNAVTVKAHGNSDAFAFYNGIDVAYKLAKAKLIDSIKEGFAGE